MDKENFTFNLFYLFALYKICHNPGLSVGIYHFLVYEIMEVYEF